MDLIDLDVAARARIADAAAALVEELRAAANPGLMEQFLTEYGLSTREGIALMTLAEAYLRTPDARTLDALIRDKIGSGDWGSHRGGGSLLISASTWALMLTGRVLVSEETYEAEFMETVHSLIRRLGEPVVRTAVEKSMRVLGGQFVQGRDMAEASRRSAPMEAKGWRYSYDMLGEAARTAADATRYFQSYGNAISSLSERCSSDDCHLNPGISVKLSALHPRYEYSQRDRVMAELVPAVSALALQARAANMGFTIDAEEAGRLELSLDVIEVVLQSPALAGWDGFGAAVQAYSKQAVDVIIGCMRWPAVWTGASRCAWSRAPIGISRSSMPRPSASPIIRSLPAKPIRMCLIWRRPGCSPPRGASIPNSPPTPPTPPPPYWRWAARMAISNSSACTAWARRCTRS